MLRSPEKNRNRVDRRRATLARSPHGSLARLAHDLDVTQEAIARRLGISQPYVNQLFQAEREGRLSPANRQRCMRAIAGEARERSERNRRLTNQLIAIGKEMAS